MHEEESEVKDISREKQWEGVCSFCGQVQQVMAASREDADEIATEKCNCDDA